MDVVVVNLNLFHLAETKNNTIKSFFSAAAKPSDLGNSVLFYFLLLGLDHFWNLPMCSFLEVCSKVARFSNSISEPK